MSLYLMCWMLWNFDFLFYLTFRDFYPIFHSSANTITNARAATSDSEPTVHKTVNWATAGKAEDEAQQIFILCTFIVPCASLKNPWFWAVLWILQKLVFVSHLISAWFPVWKPGSRCFTCSFSELCCVLLCTGHHLEPFCRVWYDHATDIPWHCPIRVIPVCITTLQQSFWHIWYVLPFGIWPSRFVLLEILAVNFTDSFEMGMPVDMLEWLLLWTEYLT